MGNRKIPLISGQYYHLYNRGNNKQTIFCNDQDYDRFIKLLFLCNSRRPINFRTDIIEKNIDAWQFDREEPLISICSWVIMPNHFHLYIKSEDTSGFGIKNGSALFMQKLCTAYAKYFNTKHERTGTIFESKFKSVHIDNDNQARYLFSYIHLNPVKLIQSDWMEYGIKNKSKALTFVSKDLLHNNFRDENFKF